IIGAHLVTAPLSFIWLYGNLSAYMDSYFQFGCYQDCLDGDSQWILCLCLAMMCPGTLLTKHLEDKVGLKLTGVVATIFTNAGLFGTVWTVQRSVAGTTVLMGVVMGLGQGVASVVAFQYVEGWAPDHASLLIATTTGASTLLSMVQNQIITAIVNPANLKPDARRDAGKITTRSLMPAETLKSASFYALFMFGTATLFSLILKANYYKQFALLYIPDDRFLTLVGTLIPVLAAASRLVLGACLNRRRVSIQAVCVGSLAVNSVLCAWWYSAARLDAHLYALLILLLALVQSVYYIIFPVAALHMFGPAHFSTNYGLLLLSFIPVGLLSPVVIPPLLHSLGWFWLF
ncbi:hypothetical protein EGW08_008772, partial [Elysia chlorotica]